MIIDGREIANQILDGLTIRVRKLKKKGITPTLAIILVGDNPESVSYVRQKELKGTKIGANVVVERLKEGISETEILSLIKRLNDSPKINGIIIQRPVDNVNPEKLDEAVLPEKDVDGFNSKSKFGYPLGEAVLRLLEHVLSSNKKEDQFYDYLRKTNIVLIGKGKTGGYPLMQTFIKHRIPLNIIDSKTIEPEKLLKSADIVISAVGKPNTVTSKTLKNGVVLISIGLSMGNDEKLHGDYNEDEIKNIASFYTPTPGGVGPVNVAMLLRNLLDSAER